MAECLASIELGDFESSPASIRGVLAGCPYCEARGADWPAEGSQFVTLNGMNAGRLSKVGNTPCNRNTTLVAALPLRSLPNWLAPFNIRTSFILDELAVWFCNHGLVGAQFCWDRSSILTVAAVCWSKRIAVSGLEVGRLLLAHGMPSEFLEKLSADFEFAVAAMRHAAGRSPIKKNRDPEAFLHDWSEVMRQWGR